MRRITYSIGAVLLLLVMFYFLFTKHNDQNKYVFNINSQTVIQQVQALNRLETASYTIEKVIDAGTSGSQLKQFLLGDRLLLIAHGTVIAGFDMSKVKAGDIQISGKSLILHLPAPEILVSKLDNDQTRVYDRQQGLLTKGDKDLESQARKEAESVIRNAACTGGILRDAEKNGRNQLTNIYKGLGFNSVIINNPQGSC